MAHHAALALALSLALVIASADAADAYSYVPGYVPAGDDVGTLPPGASVAAAQAACSATPACAAFTFDGPRDGPIPGSTYLKNATGWSGFVYNASSPWSTYARGPFGPCDVFAPGGVGAPADAGLPPFSFTLGADSSEAVLARARATHVTQPLDADRVLTTSVFYDAATGLVATVIQTDYFSLYPEQPAVRATEWLLSFANNGSTAATPPLCAIYGLNMTFLDAAGDGGETSIRRYAGSTASPVDYMSINETLQCGVSGAATYSSWFPMGGRSSDSMLPFFTLFDSGGSGFTFSVGWSGSWAAAVRRGDETGSGACNRTQVWLRHDSGNGACPGVCTPLEPGESFRALRVLRVAFPANTPASYHLGVNAHRRLIVKYKAPRTADGSAVLGAITAALGWWGFPNCPSLTFESQASMIAALKASAAVEAYWLDAEYFNGCFPDGVGNWQLPLSAVVDQEELPSGTNRSLEALGAYAQSSPAPLQFVLWVEPERVAPGTFIAREHPDYLIPAGGIVLNLGYAPALAYMTNFMQTLSRELKLDVLRLDFNTEPAGNWRAGDAPGRDGVSQLRYIEGLYAMWDACIAAQPGLLIDNCASGGRRIDLETLSRSVPLWRSDYAQPGQAAESQQQQTAGLSAFAPINSGTTDRYDPYMWRSTGSVGKTLIFGAEVWATLLANATEMAMLRAAQAETQRLRALSIFGDFYPLSPGLVDATSCAGWQYHCDGTSACGGAVGGALVVFRRPAAQAPGCSMSPFALLPAAQYSAAFYGDYALDRRVTMTGAALSAISLTLDAGACVLVEYSCMSGC
jgi:alpha-galactosidase